MNFLDRLLETAFPRTVKPPPQPDTWKFLLLLVFTGLLAYLYISKRHAIFTALAYWFKKPPKNKGVLERQVPAEASVNESLASFQDSDEGISGFKNAISHYHNFHKPESGVSVNCKTYSAQEFSLSSEKSYCHEEKKLRMSEKHKKMMQDSADNIENEYQVTMFCRIRSSKSKRKLLASDVGAKTTPLRIKSPDKYYRKRTSFEGFETTPSKDKKLELKKLEDKTSNASKVDEEKKMVVAVVDEEKKMVVAVADEAKRLNEQRMDGERMDKEKIVDRRRIVDGEIDGAFPGSAADKMLLTDKNFEGMSGNGAMVEATGSQKEVSLCETGSRIEQILKRIEAEARMTQQLLSSGSLASATRN